MPLDGGRYDLASRVGLTCACPCNRTWLQCEMMTSHQESSRFTAFIDWLFVLLFEAARGLSTCKQLKTVHVCLCPDADTNLIAFTTVHVSKVAAAPARVAL